MSSKNASHNEEDLKVGDKVALFVSRSISSWLVLAIFCTTMGIYIDLSHVLAGEKPLDIFNLGISLYTIFIEIIILRATISQRNMDRALSEKIDKTLTFMTTTDERIIKLEELILSKEDIAIKKSDEILALLVKKK
jgi:hypothetical protein